MSQSVVNTSLLPIFRILIVLQLINVIVFSPLYGVYLDVFAGGYSEIDTGGSRSGFLLNSAYVLVLLALYLCTYVGLIRFRSWGRTLLPIAMAFSLIEPFLYRQHYLFNGVEETLSTVSDYIDGIVLALVWGTDLRFRFARSVAA
jgi:hypothetical protein